MLLASSRGEQLAKREFDPFVDATDARSRTQSVGTALFATARSRQCTTRDARRASTVSIDPGRRAYAASLECSRVSCSPA